MHSETTRRDGECHQAACAGRGPETRKSLWGVYLASFRTAPNDRIRIFTCKLGAHVVLLGDNPFAKLLELNGFRPPNQCFIIPDYLR